MAAALDHSADALLQHKAHQAATHDRLSAHVTSLVQDLRRTQFDVKVAMSDVSGRCDRMEALAAEGARLCRRAEYLSARQSAAQHAVEQERKRVDRVAEDVMTLVNQCGPLSAVRVRELAMGVRALRGSRAARTEFAASLAQYTHALSAVLSVCRVTKKAATYLSDARNKARCDAVEVGDAEVATECRSRDELEAKRVALESLRVDLQQRIAAAHEAHEAVQSHCHAAAAARDAARASHDVATHAAEAAATEATEAATRATELAAQEAALLDAVTETRQRNDAELKSAREILEKAQNHFEASSQELDALVKQVDCTRQRCDATRESLSVAAIARGRRLATLRALLTLNQRVTAAEEDRRAAVRAASARLQSQLEAESAHATAVALEAARTCIIDEAARTAEEHFAMATATAVSIRNTCFAMAALYSAETEARTMIADDESISHTSSVAYMRRIVVATTAADVARRRAVRRRPRSESGATEAVWELPNGMTMAGTPRTSTQELVAPSPIPRRPSRHTLESPLSRAVHQTTAARTPRVRRSALAAPPFHLDDDEVDIFA